MAASNHKGYRYDGDEEDEMADQRSYLSDDEGKEAALLHRLREAEAEEEENQSIASLASLAKSKPRAGGGAKRAGRKSKATASKKIALSAGGGGGDEEDEDYWKTEEAGPAKRTKTRGGAAAKKAAAAEGKANQEMMLLRGLVGRASRPSLERALVDQFTAGTLLTLDELKCILDPNAAERIATPYEEATAELGACNTLTRDLLLDLSAWLPLRDRLKCQQLVCKTWNHWLNHQVGLFKDLNFCISQWSPDHAWLNADTLLRIIALAPEGSIESFSIDADCKTGKLHKKNHTVKMFKTYKAKFSNLKKLYISGVKLCKDALDPISQHCCANLEDVHISDASGDSQSFFRLLRSTPYLRKLDVQGVGRTQLSQMRTAMVIARGGGNPLLESLTTRSDFGWGFGGFDSAMSLDESLRLFTTFTSIQDIQIFTVLPTDIATLQRPFHDLPPELPSVKKLLISVEVAIVIAFGAAYGGRFMTAEHSGILNAFFNKVETLFPNLETLELISSRMYLSNRDIRGGAIITDAPCLSGAHRFPRLTKLELRNIDLDNSFNLDVPALTNLSVTGRLRATEQHFERVKATCPKLVKEYYRTADR